MRNIISKTSAALITAAILFCMLSVTVLAAPAAKVDNVNPWGNGGQITLQLSGCSGYGSITVTVEFDGTVKSASGWGFDSYKVEGNRVIATCSYSGPNSWGFDGNVGIQVEGSNISGARLISIVGDGSSGSGGGAADYTNAAPPDGPSRAHVDSVEGDDWLTTDGNKIVDMNGTQVWMTGCNWFGYNTGTNLFDGVWNCNLKESLEGIANRGFNILRVPMSAELLLQWKSGNYPAANYNQAYNSELNSMNSLQIFDYVLDLCEEYGMKVMIDIHSANTDAAGHNYPVWYTDRISAAQFEEALVWLADRYKNDDTIVAYDLKNEPHGKASETTHAIWNDSSDAANWKAEATKVAGAILDVNPHALIVVEGIEIYPSDISSNNFTSQDDKDYKTTWWGANLMGVRDYPIDLGSETRNKQLVYSVHDYGPLVYQQPWFDGGFTYDSLYKDAWHDYWLYIVEENIAPVFIGEWGGFMQGDNLKWMEYFRQLIAEQHLNFTFWCYNANSGDTGGLVQDDFKTWDEAKYAFVKEVLWMDDQGRFIGLDHAVPLGSNGIALSDWSGEIVNPVPAAGSESEDAVTEAAASEAAEVTGVPVAGGDSDGSGSGSSGSGAWLKVVLVVIGVAAAGVIVFMLIKIKGLPENGSGGGSKEPDPDAPVVVNGYLQKSNTYTPRPVYSNTAEARKAQELKEKKKSEP
ncbi:Aryl-phospho-beta-D-glucosidase BglC, GH1 family [Ruminococcaceae bacterium YRB3002]|nr:Aryl-phospho-beta-D-glucosidase BglC, GH1 family [Ruminococcaceae bacterium YRB3002]